MAPGICKCGAQARPGQRNCLGCHAEAQRRYRKTRQVSPEQYARELVRSKAGMKYRRGRIQKLPCEVCGSQSTEMHHDDYSKPYDVRWLCRPHHLAHHAAQKKAAIKDLSAVIQKYTRGKWAKC